MYRYLWVNPYLGWVSLFAVKILRMIADTVDRYNE